MGSLEQQKLKIEQDIQEACDRSGRKRSDITVVAVTKAVSVKRAREVLEAGYSHLGENRAESLIAKQTELTDGPNWHFIGNIQSRKVKDFIDSIDYLHSIDRISIVKEIQKRATRPIDCFIQVNVSGEESKSGIAPDDLQDFIESASDFDKVRIVGLMTMAPFTENQEIIRNVFQSLRILRDSIAEQQLPSAPCTQLSMGMSNDYIIAIEEGATHVRIGTALVGAESEGDR